MFWDVINGTNGLNGGAADGSALYLDGYPAGPGYDLVTGWGAPFAGHLIQAVTGTVVP